MTRREAKILLDERIRSINFNIDAIDDLVHPMGLVQDKTELRQRPNCNGAALQRIIDHARNIPYAQGMASHVRLEENPARQS